MPTSGAPLQYAQPVRDDLRYIATRQRGLILCILANVTCLVLQFVLPDLSVLFAVAGFAASVTGMVFVFMLAIRIYNTGLGIVLGILTLIPLLGLIVLLVVNGKATKILRENNIRVGILGAKPDQIPSAGASRF
jgi:hypothetical protein